MTKTLSFWSRVGIASFVLALSLNLNLLATPDIPNTNFEETISCDVEGGYLSDVWARTQKVICAGDGNSDAFDVLLSGESGSNSAWVITDPYGKILGLPAAPPFDLEGAGEGTCLIWHLSYEDGLTGAEVGLNANDLVGCYDLSNPYTVYRNGVNGGTITTNDPTQICAGDGQDDFIDVGVSGSEGPNAAWVITDQAGKILGLPAAPPFNFEGAGEGVCLIWYMRYEGSPLGLQMGENAHDIRGCFDLSNPITVYREGVDGGYLTTAGGMTEKTICAGDGISDAFDVNLTGQTGGNSAWVITDQAGKILGLPAAAPFDLEGAGEGVCLIWHLSYEDGLMGVQLGANAGDLEGCYDLSNPITVYRNTGDDCEATCDVDGGYLTTAGGMTEKTICAGDGVSDAFDVNVSGQSGENSAWVITDAMGKILGLPAAPPFDLEGAGAGVCLVWYLSFDGDISGAELGMNANDLEGCYDLSNPITVTRKTGNDCNIDCNAEGGYLSDAWGRTQRVICAGDGNSDAFDVLLAGESGSNSAWVITDPYGKILGLPAAPPFDLEGAGQGTCLIWHLSYEDGLTGVEVGLNANDLVGCYDLSNPYTVYRNGVNGGTITTNDPTQICAGDGQDDFIDVEVSGSEGPNAAWVITDQAGNILGLPAAPPFNFEGAGEGVCVIWYLRYEGPLMGLQMGKNANDFRGCYDLSNPITVYREGVDGGYLTTAGGMTEKTICAGDGISDAFDVNLTGQTGGNSAWVITDQAGKILGLPAAPPFDLEGAGEGVCLIWHLSYEDGLMGVQLGANAGDLEGCYDLSNPITVYRNTGDDCEATCGVDGGYLTTAGGMTEKTICAGDGVSDAFDVNLSGQSGEYSAWVITDAMGKILGLPAAPPFDLEGAGAGVCLIWHLSYDGDISGAEVGMNANDLAGCYDLSNPITVTRKTGNDCNMDCEVEGGYLSDAWARTQRVICAGDGNSDAFDVLLAGESGSNSAWVITDQAGNILGLPAAPPFDLEGAGEGTCLIWHLSYEDGLTGAEVGLNANDLVGCYDLSNPYTVYRNGVNGGTITTNDPTQICAGDGQDDFIDVAVSGSEGPNAAWVITDQAGNILGLPAAPPFNFEGAGEGVCVIWYLRYEGPLMGLQMGKNANDFRGCYDLSNPITVYREGVDGGYLTTAGGMMEKTICAGDGISDAFDVNLTGQTGGNSAWVITDQAGKILGLPAAPPFDLEGAGEGVCLIWHLSYEDGLMGVQLGANASDLEGCYDLSNPITVYRNTGDDCEATCEVDGGYLTTAGGMTEKTICAGDGVSDAFDVNLSGQSGENSAWVITDAMGKILGLPAAPPFDLEGAGAGVCLIWHLSFDGDISGAEVGMNANDLAGCYDLSNPITVTRKTGNDCNMDCEVEGGYLSDAWARTQRVICAGDGNSDAFDVLLAGESGSNSAWVITDQAGNILGLPAAPPFDLEGAGEGTCLIWHLSYEDGLTGAEVGLNANDLVGCYDLSNPYTVYRNGVNGGTITTNDPTQICAGDGQDDFIDVEVSGSEGPNAAWVITDQAGNILGLPAAPPFNFEGAGEGVCVIWYLRYEGPLMGLQMGKNANDFRGCFDLSNPITVYREGVDGGYLTTAGGMMEKTICAGDGISDAFDVNLTGQTGGNSAWVITDQAGKILGLPAAPPFDLEGAGEGVCLIWHLSYEDGLMGVQLGANAGDLEGCYDLSNPITVYRNTGDDCEATCEVDGGHIYTNDATTICAGDGEDDFIHVAVDDAEGENSAWVITDNDGKILGLPAAPPFNFEGAGAGVCLIWHLSFDGNISGAELGMNAADLEGCYELSNPIRVTRRTSGIACGNYNNNSHSITVAVSPNPASSQIRLDITIGEGANFRTSTIELLTSLGRRVYRRTVATYDGENTVNLEIANLQPGVYFARVKNGNQREIVRFIKQ